MNSPDNRVDTEGTILERGKRSWGKRLFVAFATFVLLVAAAAFIGWQWFQRLLDDPVSRRPFEATVVVERGATYNAIVAELEAAGLLPYPFALDYLAWRRGDAGLMKPGRYMFDSSMSVREIYQKLIEGAPIVVTIPDGWTIEQIDRRLVAEHVIADPGAFIEAASDPDWLAEQGIPNTTAEGYLLPETYHLDPGVTAGEFRDRMAAAFQRSFAEESRSTAPLDLTRHEVITLASMIEREARNESEKPIIASVYLNRLQRGMKLDCDATIRYALSKWNAPLTRSDLKTTSPYNTYVEKGLPPGPIGCVNRSSVEAVLHPAETEFLYYCYKGDRSHHFSRTLREHNAAVQKYLRKPLTRAGAEE